jgi:hypothetical protein
VAPPAPAPQAPTDAAGTVNAARSRLRRVAAARRSGRTRGWMPAARLPRGEKLADAVSAERHPAARSASIRVSRAAGRMPCTSC